MMMVMLMMMTQHFSNSRVKNTIHPSLLVIPHDAMAGGRRSVISKGKNILGAVVLNTEGPDPLSEQCIHTHF